MKQNQSRILSLLLALVLALSLAACGAQSDTQADSGAADGTSALADELDAADAAAEAAGIEDVNDTVEQGEPKTITLTVTYEDGMADEYTIETDAEYLKEAIESTVSLEGTESDYGFTVTAVNGVEADFTAGSNAYWAIYVNGEYGNYSIDAQPVADGDSFGLTYETYAG